MDPTSRYARTKVLVRRDEQGREVSYLARRFAPQRPPAVLGWIAVLETDRIDRVAARAAGDPTQYWRIADANAAMDAFALAREPGRRLAAPSPTIVEDPTA